MTDPFRPLGVNEIKQIVKIQLRMLADRLKDRRIELTLSDAAAAEIAVVGYDPVYGARPLKRAIQSQLENPLAKQILEGRFGPKDVIRVDAKKGVMTFEKLQNAAAAA